MATLTCPNCAAEVKPDDLICFTCGANLPRNRPRDDDYPAPTTVYAGNTCAAKIGLAPFLPPFCGYLSLTGNVEVPAGTSLLLGRDPAESLVAAAFANFEALRTSRGGTRRSPWTMTAGPVSGTRTPPTAPSSTAIGSCPASRSGSRTATSSGWARTFPPMCCCRASTRTQPRSPAANRDRSPWLQGCGEDGR